MLMPNYIEKTVRVYCECKNIPIENDRIPEKYHKEINDFLIAQSKRDRLHTKRKEEISGMKLGNIIKDMVGGYHANIESPIEECLYREMEKVGLMKYCKTQFEIGNKRVDFAFPEAKLVVECDGKEYHFTEQRQIEKDQERDKYLARKGWRVLHIEGLAIRRNIDLCIKKIKDQLKAYIPEIK